MNWIKSKIKRLIIRKPGYNERRRQEMIKLAWVDEARALYDTHRGSGHMRSYYSERSEMYRRRAAWYLKKETNNKK